MKIITKRVYDEPHSKDGLRILVDRLWPRGLSKETADIDLWLKAVAPSNELRKWFQHDVEKWPEFKKRYFKELKADEEAVDELLKHVKRRNVALLYAAKDEEHNNATALRDYIESQLSSKRRSHNA